MIEIKILIEYNIYNKYIKWRGGAIIWGKIHYGLKVMRGIQGILSLEMITTKKMVVIPHVVFKGKRSISWKQVEQYLISYVGKLFEVSETKDLIYIDKSFADEYAGSVYTQKLRGALPKVKANMSQGIPEMIEIATEKRWKEDFQGKHKKKAGKGWFRYNTRFALPVVNEKGDILEYNVYQAVLIVRYSSDEKLYLYDIQNIKKETRYPSWTRSSDGQKPVSFH